MADCFVGEIRLFGGNYAPMGWMLCDGSTLPISGYDMLYSLIGTTYGGDGQTNFKLPDLRGRVPLHRASNPGHYVGNAGGCEQVGLSVAQLAAHTHAFPVSGADATTKAPAGKVPAKAAMYTTNVTGAVAMNAGSIGSTTGQGQAHENMQPWQAVNYIIAVEGIYPTRD